jgi:hypothetical protein
MPTHIARAVPVAVVASLLITGCGSSSDPPDADSTRRPADGTAEATPAWPAFDPPTRFDPTPLSALPDIGPTNPPGWVPPITLFGATAFVATPSRLRAVDLASGEVVNTVTPEQAPVFADDRIVGDQGVAPPAVVEVGGAPTVLVAFAVTVPGEGTTPAESRIEIHAVNAEDASVAWSFEVAIPGDSYPPAILGVADGVLVLDHEEAVSGVDLDARSVRWHADQTHPSLLIDATVVGVRHSDATIDVMRVAGLDASDGSQRWIETEESYEYLYIHRAGASHVMITGRSYQNGSHFLRYVDSATGDPAGSRGEDGPYLLSCVYDAASISVCQMHDWAAAVDVPEGEWLWSLPDKQANRIAPTVTAAWHGAVYGETESGPVVLDAETGEDLETDPGVTPLLVNEFVGLVQESGAIYAHRAIG